MLQVDITPVEDSAPAAKYIIVSNQVSAYPGALFIFKKGGQGNERR